MAELNIDPEILAVFKQQALTHRTVVNNLLVSIEKTGGTEEQFREIKGALHTLKGDARMLGMEELSRAAHKLEDVFAGLIDAGGSGLSGRIGRIFRVLDAIGAAADALPKLIPIDLGEEDTGRAAGRAAVEPDAGDPAAAKKGDDDRELLTIDVRRLEDLVAMSSVFPRYGSRIGFLHSRFSALRKELDGAGDPALLKRFDSLLYELGHELSFFDLQSRQFQDEISRLKLVPLSVIFDLFPRLVRDVAASTGKKIDFVVRGGSVELDKLVVDKIREIIIHLLRNAVDHGCEPPAERIRQGKPEEGRVSLSAFNRGDNVMIEVSDDGRGLDTAAVKKTAVRLGHLTGEQAASLSDEQAVRLIFESGFSTSGIGEFSGRGVGLDVVARTVKTLNGEINVRSLPSQGTTFAVTLPLFSSYIPITIFTVREVLFGIPSMYIVSVDAYRPERVNRIGLEGGMEGALYETEAGPLALVDLAPLFGLGGTGSDTGGAVLAVKYKDSLVSLLADDIVLEKKLIIRKPASLERRLRIIIGAVLLGKERAIPVLNIPELFRELSTRRVAFVRDREADTRRVEFVKTVLLVEDSPVTRGRERQILLDRNLNVVEAANGKEALAVLAARPVECIVTDIEMPVMNGLELAKRCREDDALKKIPIIVVSSYGDLAGRFKDLGVELFVDKSTFSAEKLVAALKNARVL